MQTITITAYRRPHYFEQLLRSLISNELEGWTIFIFVEPSPRAAEFRALAEDILAGHDWQLQINSKLQGVKRNPFNAQKHVFEQGSELNLYLEEDFLISPDVTRLAQWYARNHRPNEVCLNLMVAACNSRGPLSQPESPEILISTRQFNSLGFVLTAGQWHQHIVPNWFKFPFGLVDSQGRQIAGWDCAIHAYVISNRQFHVLQPISARVQHIGREGGEFCDAESQDKILADMYLYHGTSEDLKYRRCEDLMELPHTVRTHLYALEEVVGLKLINLRMMRRFLFILWPIYQWKIEFQLWRMKRRRQKRAMS